MLDIHRGKHLADSCARPCLKATEPYPIEAVLTCPASRWRQYERLVVRLAEPSGLS